MAVAHDGEANVTAAGTSASTITFSAKTTAGSDRIGILSIAIANAAVITSVTWNGSNMTQAVSAQNPTDNRYAVIYYIINPPTAASDIVVSTSAPTDYVGVVSSYSGAHQTTQDGDTSSASGTTTPATVDVTSASGEMVVDALYFIGAGTSPSVGADQTQNGNSNQGTWHGASSREAGAATTTMSWTLTSSTRWTIVGFSIRATASGSTTVTPTQGTITVNGRQASVNPFTNVRLSEVLINEAGSALASMTGMGLVIWYGGAPIGSPDLSYSAVTTGGAGTMSYSLATGSLVYNQAIFYVLTDGSASLSAWTCARVIPTYS
jgi:hypothetical protein